MGTKMKATTVGLFQEQKTNYIHSDACKTFLFGNEAWAALLFQILSHVYFSFNLHTILSIV